MKKNTNNRTHYLFQNVPPDLSQCVFVIEQALSVRALQEIISSNDAEAVRLKYSKEDCSTLKLGNISG